MTPATLYRMFDADGRLLYVGISSDVGKRLKQHSQDKDWWKQVATVGVEHHKSRRHAAVAEREAIIAEKPLWNLTYNTGMSKPMPPLMVALMAEQDRLDDEQEATVPQQPAQSNPKPCDICGYVMRTGARAYRPDGKRIRLAHSSCVDEWEAEHRPEPDNFRDERRLALLRGEIL